MELSVASVSARLIEVGLLGVLVTAPPALLFGLGLRLKNRMTLACSGAMVLSLAVCMLGITLEALDTGQALALSRGMLMVERAEQPIFFWVSAVTFGGLSVFMAALGLIFLWTAMRPHRAGVSR